MKYLFSNRRGHVEPTGGQFVQTRAKWKKKSGSGIK